MYPAGKAKDHDGCPGSNKNREGSFYKGSELREPSFQTFIKTWIPGGYGMVVAF